MISTIHYMDQEITIQQTSKVIERIERIESCKCLGLTTEDIALIIRQQLVGALEFNYAIDGAMGEPTLVPLIKAMCEE
ncbi:hypothetical protein KAW50_03595 [candidate division WOR-3 bacterium]|nr:hypothetical protein [candidate division WOR-3 bacterium]